MMAYFWSYQWLPMAFMVLLGFSVLIYVILDGYDLGVGILMSRANPQERDIMVSSIGPFWDANETWLVLSVGLLLVAFPIAYGLVLTSLYIPVAIMLCGLILRGVSFDFRAKAQDSHKKAWNMSFIAGSVIASFSQGYMLGMYILGFESSVYSHIFAVVVGICLCFGYCLIGASWIIMKTEGQLQKKAVKWAKFGLYGTVLGMGLISIATPLVSPRIFAKWFTIPNIFFLMPLPIISAAIVGMIAFLLKKLPLKNDKLFWAPFACTIALFVVCFQGIAYSFYPFVVPEKLTILESASSLESLLIIFVGAIIVVPIILCYTLFTYRIFKGKTKELTYY
jgi:cytochrome d ubiquinol oxidase subunit II